MPEHVTIEPLVNALVGKYWLIRIEYCQRHRASGLIDRLGHCHTCLTNWLHFGSEPDDEPA